MSDRRIKAQIYASTADAALAERLAVALDQEGFEVVTGEFERAGSDAVLVVWSGASKTARGLLAAARAPFEAGVLVPVAIGGAAPPPGFEGLAPADLSGWGGDRSDPRWRFVAEEVRRNARRPSPPVALFDAEAAPEDLGDLHRNGQAAPIAAPDMRPARPRSSFPALAAVAVFAALALAGGFWVIGGGDFEALLRRAPADERVAPAPQTAPPTVAVIATKGPADPGDEVAVNDDDPPADEAPATEEPPGAADEAGAPDRIAALIAENAPASPPQDAAEAASETVGAAAPEPDAPAPLGDFFKECAACPEMAAIAPGRFLMGSPASEQARHASEGPQTEVAVGRFAIGTREITFEQWDACVAAGGCGGYRPDASGFGRGRQPVVNVSWADAQAYARWLSETTGERYRLPTEAEWEYAARAGAATPFSFGAGVSSAQANFDGTLPYGAGRGKDRRRPIAVGSFEPNAFGLFDMHGNVWEWVEDCWRDSHRGRPDDSSPRGGDCNRRVLKGGAWNNGGWRLRAAHRIGKAASAREFDNGFRVARDLD